MSINDELKRLGEPPATPEEEAEAKRLDEQMERLRSGAGAIDPEDPNAKTITWIFEHAKAAVAHADRLELEELGRSFPQFELLKVLPGGGMGDVYVARDVVLGVPVALKVIRSEWRTDPEFLARFKREVCVWARLSHPHIVHLRYFGQAADLWYLTMEYLPDGTLRQRLKDGPLPPDEALAIALALCDALHYAHKDKDIVHRDIKPENILFDRRQPKIGDWGLAKVIDPAAILGTPPDRAMGTRDYAAPEQWKDAAKVDHRADIYSLGVVLYEMLTGERPARNYVPASQRVKVSPKIDEVIRTALATHPAQRFENAADMRREIEAARKPPTPWCWLVAAAVLLLLGLGALSWKAFAAGRSEPKVLRWGGDAVGGAPFIWEQRGNLKGFEVELMENIALRLKMKPSFTQCAWDMLPLSLRRGDIDVIFNGYAWSGPRGREMNATFPYAVAGMRLIVRKGDNGPHAVRRWEDLRRPGPRGKRCVGTLKASASEKHLRDNYADDVEIETPSNGTVEVLLSLKNGRLDASVQDEFTARHYLQNDFPELEIVDAPVSPTFMVAYTHGSNADLRDRINAALREMMRDGTLKRIYSAYGVWSEEMDKLDDVARTWPPKDEEDSESLWPAVGLLARAATMTVGLALVAMPLAMLLGLIVAVGRLYGPFWLRWPLTGYVEVLRGTPLLLQLAAIYFLLPEFGIFLPAFWAGAIGLAINYSAYESEHYRAGILSVPRGQMEAALTLGMTRWTALRHVILPQALRTVIPSVTNDFIALFKDTAVCSVVAVVELTGQYQRLAVAQPQMIFTYAALAALFYLLMSYPLSLLARRLERRPQPVVA